MRYIFRKQTGIIVAVLIVAAVGIYLIVTLLKETPEVSLEDTGEEIEEIAAPEPQSEYAIIGSSVEGRPIEAFTYGDGETHLLFVGGIHGGYEWNSVLLAYELMDYLDSNPDVIPKNIAVSVIPSANPDGLYEVIGINGRFAATDVPTSRGVAGAGRFNANDVDLNRNFDCKWQPESSWRGNVVSAGTAAFSEPEAAAIRDYVTAVDPVAAVFFHSQSNAVYASECENGILSETRIVMNTYANAAGYPAVDEFDAYPITGDVEGWLASIGTPAITVELATHESVEWERNKKGIDALFLHYSGAAELSR